MVFVKRWESILSILNSLKPFGKFNGAVGNFNSHFAAFPNIDWYKVSKDFITDLGLEPNMCTTQIESHDIVCAIFNNS